ncbi:hypothetical protein DASC09_051830 [Saccharomycopsis crataegensis]|uniref:Uncharacterized protein n=1 Tax=Saccharomycopsis crataegensis TaxID=43959 RepID=A0AAV5QUP2_9ASCO|nr:hypothetical protein DASC09_051830 [Saccharomycopsis crataegensis]
MIDRNNRLLEDFNRLLEDFNRLLEDFKKLQPLCAKQNFKTPFENQDIDNSVFCLVVESLIDLIYESPKFAIDVIFDCDILKCVVSYLSYLTSTNPQECREIKDLCRLIERVTEEIETQDDQKLKILEDWKFFEQVWRFCEVATDEWVLNEVKRRVIGLFPRSPTKRLEIVEKSPIFIEYILPRIQKQSKYSSEEVRQLEFSLQCCGMIFQAMTSHQTIYLTQCLKIMDSVNQLLISTDEEDILVAVFKYFTLFFDLKVQEVKSHLEHGTDVLQRCLDLVYDDSRSIKVKSRAANLVVYLAVIHNINALESSELENFRCRCQNLLLQTPDLKLQDAGYLIMGASNVVFTINFDSKEFYEIVDKIVQVVDAEDDFSESIQADPMAIRGYVASLLMLMKSQWSQKDQISSEVFKSTVGYLEGAIRLFRKANIKYQLPVFIRTFSSMIAEGAVKNERLLVEGCYDSVAIAFIYKFTERLQAIPNKQMTKEEIRNLSVGVAMFRSIIEMYNTYYETTNNDAMDTIGRYLSDKKVLLKLLPSHCDNDAYQLLADLYSSFNMVTTLDFNPELYDHLVDLLSRDSPELVDLSLSVLIHHLSLSTAAGYALGHRDLLCNLYSMCQSTEDKDDIIRRKAYKCLVALAAQIPRNRQLLKVMLETDIVEAVVTPIIIQDEGNPKNYGDFRASALSLLCCLTSDYELHGKIIESGLVKKILLNFSVNEDLLVSKSVISILNNLVMIPRNGNHPVEAVIDYFLSDCNILQQIDSISIGLQSPEIDCNANKQLTVHFLQWVTTMMASSALFKESIRESHPLFENFLGLTQDIFSGISNDIEKEEEFYTQCAATFGQLLDNKIIPDYQSMVAAQKVYNVTNMPSVQILSFALYRYFLLGMLFVIVKILWWNIRNFSFKGVFKIFAWILFAVLELSVIGTVRQASESLGILVAWIMLIITRWATGLSSIATWLWGLIMFGVVYFITMITATVG